MDIDAIVTLCVLIVFTLLYIFIKPLRGVFVGIFVGCTFMLIGGDGIVQFGLGFIVGLLTYHVVRSSNRKEEAKKA